ncbi:MAG: hypothetical protein M3N17_00450 [Actinomycetota bacterium]|nr:hypothetical protein [Actinomycetota bacterium]
MSSDVFVGLGALSLMLGFPAALLALLWFLERLEEWTLRPDERAVAVTRLLEQSERAEDVERAVAAMLHDVPKRRGVRRSAVLRIRRTRRTRYSGTAGRGVEADGSRPRLADDRRPVKRA